MKAISVLALALLLAAIGSFASPQATAETTQAAEGRVFELPASPGAGDGKELSVLLDEDHLKLATVALRGGTALPAHSTPVPATVLVLEGEGVVHIGGERVPVSKGTIVSLAAGEEHDVVPAPGSDMLLLIHYLRSVAGTASPPATGC